MCDYFDGEGCDVWSEIRPVARKAHRCGCCGRTIHKGERYLRAGALHEGSWTTYRAHESCEAIVMHIAFDVCRQDAYFLDHGDIRPLVREHYPEDPKLLSMYADWLRERLRWEREVADAR